MISTLKMDREHASETPPYFYATLRPRRFHSAKIFTFQLHLSIKALFTYTEMHILEASDVNSALNLTSSSFVFI
jgi:hypothetical protein